MTTEDTPLTEDEFNQLAREGSIILSADRDNVAIHNYLTKVRGWRNVYTMLTPPEDSRGAVLVVGAIFN
jgi:hypothetical protein